jgi:hypothetical protein
MTVEAFGEVFSSFPELCSFMFILHIFSYHTWWWTPLPSREICIQDIGRYHIH